MGVRKVERFGTVISGRGLCEREMAFEVEMKREVGLVLASFRSNFRAGVEIDRSSEVGVDVSESFEKLVWI